MELIDFALVTVTATLSSILFSSLTVVPLYSDDFEEVVNTLTKLKLDINWVTPTLMASLSVFGYIVMFKIDTWTALFVIILTLITLVDFKYMLIPNRLLLALAIAISFMIYKSPYISIYEIGDRLLVAICVFILTYLMAIITDGKLGGADIKILTILAFAFDFSEYLVVLSVMCIPASIFSLICIIFRNNKPYPLIPFIHIGVITALFFGDIIINKYLEVQLY